METDQKKGGLCPIVGVLDKNGLDKTFWFEQFRKIGIIDDKQLQHADIRDFYKLCMLKRYTWEENALKDCFPSIKEQANEKRKAARMPLMSKAPMINFVQNLPNLESREELIPSEIVCQISAGRILRGFYIQKDAWERVVPRKKLIKIPQDLEIFVPTMEETFTSREFFSEDKAALYDHVLQNWGWNATVSVGLLGILTVDIGTSIKSAADESQGKIASEGYSEIQETVFVPTASFSLEDIFYGITPEAINALTKLETRLAENNGKQLCIEFFKTFGSHYFTGTYHFGGRFTRSVICRSKTTMTKTECIRILKSELQVGGSGILNWFQAGGKVKVDTSEEKSTAQLQEHQDYEVEKKIIKYGGPPETDSIPEWKLGLVKYPATWNIIDQEVYKDEWRGVWELLTDDLSPKFKDIENLRTTLQKVWEDEFKETFESLQKQKQQFHHVL